MEDNKEQIVKYIAENDCKSLKDHFDSITNKSEANYSLLKESTNNMSNKTGNDDLQTDESIPIEGLTLLHVAAYYDSLECFQYIEREGKLPLKSLSARGLYPLHYACYNGSNEVALYILSKDPDEAKSHPEVTSDLQLLYCATKGSDPEILQALFDRGAKMNDQWNNGEKLISIAISLHNREILGILMENKTDQKQAVIDSTKATPSMKAVISHNVDALEVLYRGEEDLKASFYDKYGYHNLVNLICETDQRKVFRNVFKRILTDAKDVQIEPEIIQGKALQAGVCHWACTYMDIEIARLMFKTPNVQINRFDQDYKTGAFKLIEKSGNEVTQMLEFLYNQGFDFNAKKDDQSQSLLEGFILAMNKNFDAIEFLVTHGADVNAINSKNKKITLIQHVKAKGNPRLKKIFGLTKK